jgi:hypothetical protein
MLVAAGADGAVQRFEDAQECARCGGRMVRTGSLQHVQGLRDEYGLFGGSYAASFPFRGPGLRVLIISTFTFPQPPPQPTELRRSPTHRRTRAAAPHSNGPIPIRRFRRTGPKAATVAQCVSEGPSPAYDGLS